MERVACEVRPAELARVSALRGAEAGADDGVGTAGDDAAREADGLCCGVRAGVGVGVGVGAAEEVAEAEGGRLDAVVVGCGGAEGGEARRGRHAVGRGGGRFVGLGVFVFVFVFVFFVHVRQGGSGCGVGAGEGRVSSEGAEGQVVEAEGVFVLSQEGERGRGWFH